MSETELDAARNETVNGISGCLYRLSRVNKLLTLPQRVALAEIARDLADAFDEGRTLSPQEEGKIPRRRFVKTDHIDENGRPLFRQINW